MKRSCPRTLDRPILLFGLEAEDVAGIALVVGLGSLLVGPAVPGLVGITSWLGLIYVKKDKPEGFLLHTLYALGLPLPGMVKPIAQVQQYAIL